MMEIIIFTAILFIIILYIILKIFYKKIKPSVDKILKVIDAADDCTSVALSEFSQTVHYGLIEFNAILLAHEFNRMLENKDKHIEYMKTFIDDERKQKQIKEKSILKLNEKYKLYTKTIKKYKIEALQACDSNLLDALEQHENDLKLSYEALTQLKDFVMLDIVLEVEECNKNINKIY